MLKLSNYLNIGGCVKILVVLASVRKGRAGEKVAKWFVEAIKADGRFETDLVDLKDLDLSYEISETLPSTVQNSEYEDEKDRQWASRVNEVDAVVFVSPEYNHGLPASLKNALDHLYLEWNNKPAAFVGYGAAGAPYSNAALALVAGWVKLDLISARVGISEIWAAFNEDGTIKFADYYEHQVKNVLDSLEKKIVQ